MRWGLWWALLVCFRTTAIHPAAVTFERPQLVLESATNHEWFNFLTKIGDRPVVFADMANDSNAFPLRPANVSVASADGRRWQPAGVVPSSPKIAVPFAAGPTPSSVLGFPFQLYLTEHSDTTLQCNSTIYSLSTAGRLSFAPGPTAEFSGFPFPLHNQPRCGPAGPYCHGVTVNGNLLTLPSTAQESAKFLTTLYCNFNG